MLLKVGPIGLVNPGVGVKLHGTRISTLSAEWELIQEDTANDGRKGSRRYSLATSPPLEVEWKYECDQEALWSEISVTNVGKEEVLLEWLAPLWCGRPLDGRIDWGGSPPTELRMIGQSLWMGGGGVTELTRMGRHPAFWAAESYWSAIISPGADLLSLTLGIGDRANTQQRICARVMGGQLDLSLQSDMAINRQGAPYRLPAGKTFSVQPVVLAAGSTREESARRYTRLLSQRSGKPSERRSHGGVFSGYGMSARPPRPERVSDAAFIRKMAEVMRDLDAPGYGITFFKTQFSRFSTGPKSPYLPERPAVWPEIPADHMPDHIIRHGFVRSYYDLSERAPEGVKPITDHLRSCGFVPAFDSRPYLNLDATERRHDELVADLYGRIVEEWGYDYLMFDFLSTDFESRDDRRTMSEAVADRMLAIRRQVGQQVFLEACMCTLGPVLGIVDGFRPAEDWRPGIERQLASEFASRYYYHGDVLLEDMEYVDVSARPACWDVWNNRAFQSVERVRTMVTLSAITGFSTLIGGFLDEMGPERWRVFTRCLPVVGLRGEPLDYPEHDPPQMWRLRRDIAGTTLTVLAVFNWDENVEAVLPLSHYVNSAPGAFAFDFWKTSALQPGQRGLEARLAPMQSAVYFVTESDYLTAGILPERPLYIGTDRHVLGDPGLEELSWNAKSRELRGAVRLAGDTRTSLFFQTPASLAPDLDETVGCVADMPQYRVLRVDVTGASGDLVRWTVPFRDDWYLF